MGNPVGLQQLADFTRLLAYGTSITIATRDGDLTPDCVRCCAAMVQPDGTVLVAIAMPEGERALANIEANRVVALTACRPTSYEALQLKGIDAKRCAWPEAARAADANRDGFVREIVEVGMPAPLGAALWSQAWSSIVFTPTEMRTQTPGAVK